MFDMAVALQDGILSRMLHIGLTSTKRFTNLKVNLKHLRLYIGAKMQLVPYEFEYFYQSIMTGWGLRDSKGPILMLEAHLVQN